MLGTARIVLRRVTQIAIRGTKNISTGF